MAVHFPLKEIDDFFGEVPDSRWSKYRNGRFVTLMLPFFLRWHISEGSVGIAKMESIPAVNGALVFNPLINRKNRIPACRSFLRQVASSFTVHIGGNVMHIVYPYFIGRIPRIFAYVFNSG